MLSALDLVVGLTLVALIAVAVYIVYRITRTDMQSQALLKGVQRLERPLVVSADKVPTTLNGREYAMSFWVYLTDFGETDNPKLLLARAGKPTATGASAALVTKVLLGSADNAVAFQVATDKTDAAGAPRFLTAMVDYLPLQRWVHLALAVQDGTLSVYVDGSLYTVEDVVSSLGAGGSSGARPIIQGASGEVYIGGALSSTYAAAAGAVANVQFFNYAPSSKDVAVMYEGGPAATQRVLNLVDIPQYGLRAPIYSPGDVNDGAGDNACDA